MVAVRQRGAPRAAVLPGAGHYYAGGWKEGFKRLARRALLRGGCWTLGWLGTGLLMEANRDSSSDKAAGGTILVIVGGALAIARIGYAICDLRDSGDASRRANHRRTPRVIAAAPVVSGSHGAAPGLSLAASF